MSEDKAIPSEHLFYKDEMKKMMTYINQGAQGNSVILGASNPAWPMPDWLIKIEQDALEHKYDMYDQNTQDRCDGTTRRYYSSRSPRGIEPLRTVLSSHFKNQGIMSGEVFVGGSLTNDLLYKVLNHATDKGDIILGQVPFFGQFFNMIDTCGRYFVSVSTQVENDWKMQPSALQEMLEKYPDSRMMIFVNPINPTGTVYDRQELYELSDVILSHNKRRIYDGKSTLLVVSDEIFSNTLITGKQVHSIASVEGMSAHTITLSSLSKEIMPGVKCAFGIGPKNIIQKCTEFLEGASYSAQNVAAAIFSPANHEKMQAHYQKNTKQYQHNFGVIKDMLEKVNDVVLLEKCGIMNYQGARSMIKVHKQPDAGFQMTIDASGLKGARLPGHYVERMKLDHDDIFNSMDLAYYLRDMAKIEMMPGEGFGISGDAMVLRMTMSKRPERYEALSQKLYDALSALDLTSAASLSQEHMREVVKIGSDYDGLGFESF